MRHKGGSRWVHLVSALVLVAAPACTEEIIGGIAGVLSKVVTVPVRWCAVEGSPQTEGKVAGETVGGSKLHDLVSDANFEIALAEALILLTPAPSPEGIPVVADPKPDSFTKGDIIVSGFSSEMDSAAAACERAWANLYPGSTGIVLLNARMVIGDAGVTGGAAPTAPLALWVKQESPLTGQRGDDLCGSPRDVTAADVAPMLKLVVYDQDLFGGATYSGDSMRPPRVLAHEVAHTLMIGHGNGLDDNGDGRLPPEPGPRRYDDYCDAQGEDEDDVTPRVDCESSSIMIGSSGCANFHPLQEEQMREVARLVPGATFRQQAAVTSASLVGQCPPQCPVAGRAALVEAEVIRSPAGSEVALSHELTATLPTLGESEHLTYVDADGDPATGCNPASIGLTEFPGAELVTRALVRQSGRGATVDPTVWRCDNGSLVEQTDPAVEATLNVYGRAVHGDRPAPATMVVTVALPDALAPVFSDSVGMEAVVRAPDAAVERLPAAGGPTLVPFGGAPLPRCSVGNEVLRGGAGATVTVEGFLSGASLTVYFDDREVGRATADARGSASIEVEVPAEAASGLVAVAVRAAEDAATATCATAIEEVPARVRELSG